MNKNTSQNQMCIFCQLCFVLTPAYLSASVIRQLASAAAVHANVRVKVGVASRGGVWLGADRTGVYGGVRVFGWVTWFLLVQAESFGVHLLQLPPF